MRSDLRHDLAVGTVVDGRLRVVEPLGMGGMGSVYRAYDATQDEHVALKMLHADVGDREEPRLRFEREARALAALEHPHIVPVRGYGVAGGTPYLVMGLLSGRTLTEVLATQSPLEPARALDLAAQILDGVAFAHGEGIIHRDLKSPNVLVTSTAGGKEHAWILDFGFAKFYDKDRWAEERTLTAEGDIFGTPAYMSPEQAAGAKVDARTDVYALGILLFELLTGQRPFRSKDRQELYKMQLAAPVPRLRSIHPDLRVPASLEEVVYRALAKDPDDRFADAGEMKRALEASATSTQSGGAQQGADARAGLFTRWPMAVGLGLLLAVAAALVAVALR